MMVKKAGQNKKGKKQKNQFFRFNCWRTKRWLWTRLFRGEKDS